jgi:hypothetical protein
MAELKPKEGELTTADLASFGILQKDPENTKRKETNDETEHERPDGGQIPPSEGGN